MQPPPPLPNSYWVEPGRLLAGEYPAGSSDKDTKERLHRLIAGGIDCFIDLTEPGEREPYEKFLPGPQDRRPVAYLQRPIHDHGLPHSTAEMQEILDALDSALADGRRIYLHCRAGIGRTNLVLGCWHVSRGATGDVALDRLNERWQQCARSKSWPTVPETEAQYDYVRNWQGRPGPAPVARAETPKSGDLRDRVHGLMLGLAAGDAQGHAAHGLPAGAWSDKMAMALCLSESLVRSGGLDAADQVGRYQAWQRMGYWTSTDVCVGITSATAKALATAQWTGNPYAGSHDPATASAEPLARIGPAVVWHLADSRAAVDAVVQCARITHQAPETLDAARHFSALLVGALRGASKAVLLAPDFSPEPGFWDRMPLKPRIREIAGGSWRSHAPRSLVTGEHAAGAALERALSAFDQGNDLLQCLQAAAGRGRDTETVAAMVGQLAGAHYGASAISQSRRAGLARRAEIEAMADALIRAA